MSAAALTVTGVVVDVGRGDYHHVDVTIDGRVHRALARRSGRMIVHRVFVVAGDTVTVELSPFDLRRGRIVHRGPPRAATQSLAASG